MLWSPTARADGVPQHLASMAKELFVQSTAELKSSTDDPKQDAVRRRARKILKEAGIRYWAREDVRAGSAKEKPRKHTMTVGDNYDQLDITWDPEKNSFEIRIKANETIKDAGDGFDLRLNGDVSLSPQTGGENAILSVRPRDQAISVLTDEEFRILQGDIFGKWRSGDGEVWEISDDGGVKGKPPPVKNDKDPNGVKGDKPDKGPDKSKDIYQDQAGEEVVDPFNKKGPRIAKSLLDLHRDDEDNSEDNFNQAQETIHGEKTPAEETDGYRSLRDRYDRVGGKIANLEDEFSTRIENASQELDDLRKALEAVKGTPENPKGKQQQKLIDKALEDGSDKLSKEEKKFLGNLRAIVDWINRLRRTRATLNDMLRLLEDTGSIYKETALNQKDGGNASLPLENQEDRIAELQRQIEKIRTEKVHRWENSVTGEVVLQEPDKFRKLEEPFEYDLDSKKEIARLQKKVEEIKAVNKRPIIAQYDPVGTAEMRASGKAQSLTIQVTDKDGYSWTYDTALMLNDRIIASRTLRNMKDLPSRMPPYMMRQAITSFSPPEWIELEVKLDIATRQVHMTGQRWRMHYDHVGSSSLSGGKRTIVKIHTPWSRDLRLERMAEQTGEPELKLVRITSSGIEEVHENIEFYGGPYYLEAIYKEPQDSSMKSVKWESSGRSEEPGSLSSYGVAMYPLDSNPNIFRSEQFYIFPESVQPKFFQNDRPTP